VRVFVIYVSVFTVFCIVSFMNIYSYLFCNVWVCVCVCLCGCVGFVMCACFCNICKCIYCVLYCFVYEYLFLFVL